MRTLTKRLELVKKQERKKKETTNIMRESKYS
jgi:hypothetical protein